MGYSTLQFRAAHPKLQIWRLYYWLVLQNKGLVWLSVLQFFKSETYYVILYGSEVLLLHLVLPCCSPFIEWCPILMWNCNQFDDLLQPLVLSLHIDLLFLRKQPSVRIKEGVCSQRFPPTTRKLSNFILLLSLCCGSQNHFQPFLLSLGLHLDEDESFSSVCLRLNHKHSSTYNRTNINTFGLLWRSVGVSFGSTHYSQGNVYERDSYMFVIIFFLSSQTFLSFQTRSNIVVTIPAALGCSVA